MMYDLPTSVEIGGSSYEIRSDYRAILDIMVALSDPDLAEQDRAFVALSIFYPDFESISSEDIEEALKTCFWFIGGGEEDSGEKSPKLVDWEQDFPRIVSPVNRVLGQEIRSIPYFHWWSFLSAYMEIGDCFFAQIVNIRSKKAKGKKLDKAEQEFYKNNRKAIDFKMSYTEKENDFLDQWLGTK